MDHTDEFDLEEWSMAIWVKVAGATGTYQMVMGKENWPDRNFSMWILPTVMTFGFTSGGNDLQVGVGDVVDDNWHYLVGTYDGDPTVGAIDEVAVYDHALSEDEVATTMEGLQTLAVSASSDKLATRWGPLKSR